MNKIYFRFRTTQDIRSCALDLNGQMGKRGEGRVLAKTRHNKNLSFPLNFRIALAQFVHKSPLSYKQIALETGLGVRTVRRYYKTYYREKQHIRLIAA